MSLIEKIQHDPTLQGIVLIAFALGVFLMVVGLALDFKPWRSRAAKAERKMRQDKALMLRFLDENDPELNWGLLSPRRTTKARPAEAKALYLAARKRAIELGLKPPLPAGDDEQDLLTLRQWLES